MEYVAAADQSKINQAWRQTAVVMAFFAITPVALIIVGKLVIHETFDGDLATYQEITKLLYGGTIGLGLAVIALRRIGFWLLARRTAGANAISVLRKLRSLALLGAAAGELIGILGLVAAFITHEYQFCWRMGVVSLAVILYSFPRRSEWERAIAAATE